MAADDGDTAQIVGAVIRPLMAAQDIPGMAVGVIVQGKSYVFDYGLASLSPKRPVTADTLFELGSISKTFTATLTAYAQGEGDLSLGDTVGADFPPLRGSAFDHVTLAELGTYTPGGMPLQLPGRIQNHAELIAYFRAWQPRYAPGSVRTYANPSIGLLGLLTAYRMHADFSSLVQEQLFPALGLHHSFMDVPPDQMRNYAEGYRADGGAIRMREDALGPEAYGVRTTAADLLRFLSIQMGMVQVALPWHRAVLATHTGYDRLRAGDMVQDLVWEQFALPVTLAALQAGNSVEMLLQPNPVTPIDPPQPPAQYTFLNKTGTTNGFASYVAFIPAQHIAIVLLGNKDFPIPERVKAAYAIVTRLGATGLKGDAEHAADKNH